MKKHLIIPALLLLTACGGRSGSDKYSSDTLYVPPVLQEEPMTSPDRHVQKISRDEYLDSWKKNGVDALSFDADGYLVYQVAENDLTASPSEVAHTMFQDALNSGVDSLRGCRIINLANEEIGRYE